MTEKKDDIEQLEPITIRFTKDAMAVLGYLAEMNQISKAEIVRYCVDDRLEKHLSRVYVLDNDEAKMIREEVCKLATVLQQIRLELNRIGVNFNQYVKKNNIQHKNSGKLMDTHMGTTGNYIESEYETLFQNKLDNIATRFEESMEKGGEVLWRILE